jgi:hypothetical protein
MAFMALLTPVRFWEALLAVGVVLGLCALGCGGSSRARRGHPSVIQAARQEARAWDSQPGNRQQREEESAALVARALHDTGLRFGTDGSTRALWGYLRTAHKTVPPAAVRPGDIVFFDRKGSADRPPECADHTGIVTEVSPAGRISFLEVRDGQVRTSYAHPGWPVARRDDRDQVLNSFLRPKKIDDPPDGRYYAGEMLCGAARVSHP